MAFYRIPLPVRKKTIGTVRRTSLLLEYFTSWVDIKLTISIDFLHINNTYSGFNVYKPPKTNILHLKSQYFTPITPRYLGRGLLLIQLLEWCPYSPIIFKDKILAKKSLNGTEKFDFLWEKWDFGSKLDFLGHFFRDPGRWPFTGRRPSAGQRGTGPATGRRIPLFVRYKTNGTRTSHSPLYEKQFFWNILFYELT